MTIEKMNRKILPAQRPGWPLLCSIGSWKEFMGGLSLYKLCIKSIERGREIKRQIVPLEGEIGYISYNTIQTAIGQFHSLY